MLWPALTSLFYRTGLGETGLRFFITLLSTGIVVSSYLLIKEMFNKKYAILVSTCITFSWVILFFTGRPLTNLPATFFLLTSILFFWKGYVLKQGNKFIYLFGLFFIFSIMTRMQYLMFILPLLIFMFTKEKFRFIPLWVM